jgi:lysozyme
MSVHELIEKHEGRRKKVYKDSRGFRTIGVGHNIDGKGLSPDIEAYLEDHGEITDLMIDILLDQDIEDAITDCERLYPAFSTFSENRQDALIDFLFNVGYATARTFVNTNKHINSGEWEKAHDGLLASLYAKQVKGRAVEIAKMLKEG